MENAGKILSLFGVVFLLMGLMWNISGWNLPKIPGDIDIDRWGIKIYIPFVSALVASVVLTLLFNFFK